MTAFRHRGACPALATPMATGDGLLTRLIPAGALTLDAFAGLCAAARVHGNARSDGRKKAKHATVIRTGRTTKRIG